MGNDKSGFDIFISYRRADAVWVAGRIHDFLKVHFDAGRIFRDTEQIALGQKFPKSIEQALQNCKVMLVPIGSKWLTISDEFGRRRLDKQDDWVRTEIRTALERDILIIPIFFDGATPPPKEALPKDLQELTEIQGIPNLQDKYFFGQMMNLIDTLKSIVELSSGNDYLHIDELREIVRENLIESDDEELKEYMKETLRDEIVQEWQEDSYNDYIENQRD